MNVSQQIADWLTAQGIEQVFCVTGGGAMFLNHALGTHPGLRCTYMHHEQACAMAAEGYARITGKPAVVNVTTGPGGINALNGVFGAYTDSVPMLVLSGQVKRATCLHFVPIPGLRQLGDQEGPVIDMARSVTKYAEVAHTPEDLATLLPAALTAATSGRPGPAWIDIPLDIQSAAISLSLPGPTPPAIVEYPTLTRDCQQIVARLRSAQRPLILAGSGVRIAGADAALLALAEQTGIPIATAWTHDLIASDHPLFAGRPGAIGTRAGNFCVQASDLLLVIGSRLNIRQVSYNWSKFAPAAFIVQVDIDRAELEKPFVQPALRIVADAACFIETLAAREELTRLPDYGDWSRWCHALQDRYPVLQPHHSLAPRLNPYRIVDHVFSRLRSDDIVVCGNASACILPFQVGRLSTGQRMFSNSGAASMGYDLPAAIGAALGAPTRRVICFAGDGSLQMNVQELQTLKTLGARVLVIILANGGYLSIRQTHENFFGTVVGATPASGVEFPDFAALARAYGLRAARIADPNDLPELDNLLALDGPALIHIEVDPDQPFEPRIKSRILADGTFATPELDDMFPFLPAAELAAVRMETASLHARPWALAQPSEDA
ncbi:thiamine pyrophosphate-binding protein [uncultured Thiodictyon sp.]|uniref:thiamine pyrophosphate-binding protein n=1 Tax=uncultured Thiodictyon sp. TaxID=1846217 RepID=UPI0025E9B68F|nr:thiamine pyrophosphate-binding protein [uncultured Thiodictyon sp.]